MPIWPIATGNVGFHRKVLRNPCESMQYQEFYVTLQRDWMHPDMA